MSGQGSGKPAAPRPRNRNRNRNQNPSHSPESTEPEPELAAPRPRNRNREPAQGVYPSSAPRPWGDWTGPAGRMLQPALAHLVLVRSLATMREPAHPTRSSGLPSTHATSSGLSATQATCGSHAVAPQDGSFSMNLSRSWPLHGTRSTSNGDFLGGLMHPASSPFR